MQRKACGRPPICFSDFEIFNHLAPQVAFLLEYANRWISKSLSLKSSPWAESELFWPHNCHFHGRSCRETACYNDSWTTKTGVWKHSKMSRNLEPKSPCWILALWLLGRGTSDNLLKFFNVYIYIFNYKTSLTTAVITENYYLRRLQLRENT